MKKRVYLVFDIINIPSDQNGDSSDCSSNYVSIASEKKPFDIYKLCGNRKGVKLITTYNNVLINFVMNKNIADLIGSFSLIYRIITDPSACNFLLFILL